MISIIIKLNRSELANEENSLCLLSPTDLVKHASNVCYCCVAACILQLQVSMCGLASLLVSLHVCYGAARKSFAALLWPVFGLSGASVEAAESWHCAMCSNALVMLLALALLVPKA